MERGGVKNKVLHIGLLLRLEQRRVVVVEGFHVCVGEGNLCSQFAGGKARQAHFTLLKKGIQRHFGQTFGGKS
ncbi:MAG: hypothetical protein Q8K50_15900 [Hydrogenophaga sp.]|nr:hypothetical protein [Hydrogenophaga sp.]